MEKQYKEPVEIETLQKELQKEKDREVELRIGYFALGVTIGAVIRTVIAELLVK